MSGTSKPEKDKGIHEINMTPLIDVSLVLVIMLLLLTPLAFESSIAIRKAVASARTSEKKLKEERIELSVVSEDSILVNKALIARGELAGTLRPMLESKTDRRVVIECSDQVSHGVFVDVLDQVKLCGAGEIAVLGR
jgi:biopolymer transport protein ExbD